MRKWKKKKKRNEIFFPFFFPNWSARNASGLYLNHRLDDGTFLASYCYSIHTEKERSKRFIASKAFTNNSNKRNGKKEEKRDTVTASLLDRSAVANLIDFLSRGPSTRMVVVGGGTSREKNGDGNSTMSSFLNSGWRRGKLKNDLLFLCIWVLLSSVSKG